MTKQTTAQVAKSLGLTKSRLRLLISQNPQFRPKERISQTHNLAWSEDDIKAIQAFIIAYPQKRRLAYYPGLRAALTEYEDTSDQPDATEKTT